MNIQQAYDQLASPQLIDEVEDIEEVYASDYCTERCPTLEEMLDEIEEWAEDTKQTSLLRNVRRIKIAAGIYTVKTQDEFTSSWYHFKLNGMKYV